MQPTLDQLKKMIRYIVGMEPDRNFTLAQILNLCKVSHLAPETGPNGFYPDNFMRHISALLFQLRQDEGLIEEVEAATYNLTEKGRRELMGS